MCRVGKIVISHHAVEMAIVQDPIQELGHRIRGVCVAIYLEEMHEATLNPFMCGELLDVKMASMTARATMVGDENGARVVFRDEGALSDGESQVID
jgi:hypothetical protein